jgi:hypothetical protein
MAPCCRNGAVARRSVVGSLADGDSESLRVHLAGALSSRVKQVGEARRRWRWWFVVGSRLEQAGEARYLGMGHFRPATTNLKNSDSYNRCALASSSSK